MPMGYVGYVGYMLHSLLSSAVCAAYIGGTHMPHDLVLYTLACNTQCNICGMLVAYVDRTV